MAAEGRGFWSRMKDSVAGRRRRWRRVEPRTRIRIRCDRIAHGGWWIYPQVVRPGDVVYTFDVGGDLGFEREVAGRYSARVFAFDPDPAAAARAAESNLEGLRFFEMSVGGRDERRTMTLGSGGSVETRMLRLPSHMRLLGHRRLDMIRLDVPGVEADVIRDLVGMDVDVHQLLLHYHGEQTTVARDRTDAALAALAGHGYRVFHSSPDARRFSLIRTDFANP